MLFEELKLIEPILKALRTEGYTTPTQIQEKAIPIILEKKDLIGCAQTGTGKTAAFALPILQTLYLYCEENSIKKPRHIKVLILTPTRELAVQIGDSFKAYGSHTGLRQTVVFGGVSQISQTNELKLGVDILIATPGRLLDLINQKYISLSHINIFVLDEADNMLDMGFIHDVKKIIAFLPRIRQTLMFSATMPQEISKLAETILLHPEKVEVTPVSSTVDTIQQAVYFVGKKDKKSLLVSLLKNKTIASALVFTRTKHGADNITRVLTKAEYRRKLFTGINRSLPDSVLLIILKLSRPEFW